MSNNGQMITLNSADGFAFSAYQSLPPAAATPPKGGIVVIQEIFGVNNHIREVADGYAQAGYAVLAPAIFDRIKPDIELGYEASDVTEGFAYAFEQLKQEQTLQDIAAAVDALKQYGKVGTVGYCFGGLMSYLSAGKIAALDCAIAYYGGGIADNLNTAAQTPIMFHFGNKDKFIPAPQVTAIKAALPNAPVHVYDADHGFNCDHRASYDEASATLARQRSLAFFGEHIG